MGVASPRYQLSLGSSSHARGSRAPLMGIISAIPRCAGIDDGPPARAATAPRSSPGTDWRCFWRLTTRWRTAPIDSGSLRPGQQHARTRSEAAQMRARGVESRGDGGMRSKAAQRCGTCRARPFFAVPGTRKVAQELAARAMTARSLISESVRFKFSADSSA